MTTLKRLPAIFCMIIGTILISPHCSEALELSELSKRANPATVFLYYDATDSRTGGPIPVRGSGLIVSRSGHVLTAYHILKSWLAQTSAEKDKNRLWAKIGSIHAEGLELELESYETDEPDGRGSDIAVLKIRRPGVYKVTPACYTNKTEMGDRVVAFGFPGAEEFNYAEGRIANSDGPGNRWTANINFDRGMSGGPVYDGQKGMAIGLVKGGLRDVAPVRYITQLTRAKAKLEAAGVSLQNCESTAAGGPRPPPAGCREIGFIDYSKVPPQISKRTVCD